MAAQNDIDEFNAQLAGQSNKGNSYISELETQEETQKEDKKKRDAENTALSNIDADLEGLYKALEEINQEIAENEAKQEQAKTNIENCNKELEEINDEIDAYRKELEFMREGRNITASMLKTLGSQLEEAQAVLKREQDKVAAIEKNEDDFSAANAEDKALLDNAEIEMIEYTFIDPDNLDSEPLISEDENGRYVLGEIGDNSPSKYEEAKALVQQANEALDRIDARLAEFGLTKNPDEFSFSNIDITEAIAEHNERNEGIEDAKFDVSMIEHHLEDMVNQLEQYDTDIPRVEQIITNLEKRRLTVEGLKAEEVKFLESLKKEHGEMVAERETVVQMIEETERLMGKNAADNEKGMERLVTTQDQITTIKDDPNLSDDEKTSRTEELQNKLEELREETAEIQAEKNTAEEEIENKTPALEMNEQEFALDQKLQAMLDGGVIPKDAYQDFIDKNPQLKSEIEEIIAKQDLKVEGWDRQNGSFAKELDNEGGIKTDIGLNSAFASAVQGPSAVPTAEPAPAPDFTQKQDYSPNSGIG